MSCDRDDLVGLALGALDSADAERIRRAVEADDALAAELREIERHLALHEGVPHGVQVVGQRFREDMCLDAAEVIQRQVGIMPEKLWQGA